MFYGEGDFRVFLHFHLGLEPPASMFLCVCLFSPEMTHHFAKNPHAFPSVELAIIKYPNQIVGRLNEWFNIYLVHKSLDL